MRSVNVIAAFVLALLAFAAPASAQQASMKRELDPLIVRGKVIESFWGKKLEQLRAYALRNDAWEPVPYQIDKVNADGDYFIATNTVPESVREEADFDEVPEAEKRKKRIKKFEKESKKLLKQVEAGELSRETFEEKKRNAYFVENMEELDYNDELVFMARDAGGRASKDKWLTDEAIEIEITDPIDGGKAWLYLFHFKKAAPPRSAIDYITYDPKGDTIISRLAEIDFIDDKPMIVETIIGKPPGKEPLPNVLDRFKLRIKVKPTLLFCAPLNFDENNSRAFTIGYKDGPVRVIRRNIFWIVIGGVKLPFAPKIVMYFQFYENGLATEADLYVPVDPGWFVCSGSFFKAGLDLRESTYGAKVFTQDNHLGRMVIDGKMSSAESNLVEKKQLWIAGYLPNRAAMMSRLRFDRRMIELGAVPDLYYVDDASKNDGPENEPGEHLIGYKMDVKYFPEGKYRLGFQIYTAYDFEEEDVQQLLNIDDHPLQVKNAAP